MLNILTKELQRCFNKAFNLQHTIKVKRATAFEPYDFICEDTEEVIKLHKLQMLKYWPKGVSLTSKDIADEMLVHYDKPNTGALVQKLEISDKGHILVFIEESHGREMVSRIDILKTKLRFNSINQEDEQTRGDIIRSSLIRHFLKQITMEDSLSDDQIFVSNYLKLTRSQLSDKRYWWHNQTYIENAQDNLTKHKIGLCFGLLGLQKQQTFLSEKVIQQSSDLLLKPPPILKGHFDRYLMRQFIQLDDILLECFQEKQFTQLYSSLNFIFLNSGSIEDKQLQDAIQNTRFRLTELFDDIEIKCD